MANRYLTDLTTVTPATGDKLVISDNSDADFSKKITLDALATFINSVIGGNYQPLDTDLTQIAALSTTSLGRSVLATAPPVGDGTFKLQYVVSGGVGTLSWVSG